MKQAHQHNIHFESKCGSVIAAPIMCVCYGNLEVAQRFNFKEGVPACSEFCSSVVAEKTAYIIIVKS